MFYPNNLFCPNVIIQCKRSGTAIVNNPKLPRQISLFRFWNRGPQTNLANTINDIKKHIYKNTSLLLSEVDIITIEMVILEGGKMQSRIRIATTYPMIDKITKKLVAQHDAIRNDNDKIK